MFIRNLSSLATVFFAGAILSTTTACDDDTTKVEDAGDTSGISDTSGPSDTLQPDGQDTSTHADTATSVDPLCDEGQYSEARPLDQADLSALSAAYNPAEHKAFIAGVLDARYPVGASLVADGLRLGTRMGDCVDLFIRQKSTPNELIRQLSTVVHECGHFLDVSQSGFSTSHFQILADKSFVCPRIGNDLARSRMNQDDYADLFAEDSYKSVYLDGDPTNATFEGGDQGFDSVLEETTQYVNSLATDWAFRDNIPSNSSISARDGLLTFLWYTMRYLRLARLNSPATYAAIRDNACWREAVLTVWGRAWFYLDLSDGVRSLGIRDARLMELVLDEDLLSEVDALRGAHGCNTP